MGITKTQSAVLSLIFISFYTYGFFGFLTANHYYMWTLGFFLVGELLMFLRIIETGTYAEVTFFNSGTGIYWSDGVVLSANPFPFLRNIGINTFWDIFRPITERLRMAMTTPEIYHYVDQSKPRYNINVETTFWTAKTDMLITNLLSWLFGFQKGDPELLFQRIGFRILLVTLLSTWVLNFTHPIDGVSQKGQEAEQVAEQRHSYQQGAVSSTIVSVQLSVRSAEPPLYPDRNDFSRRDGTSYKTPGSVYRYYRPMSNRGRDGIDTVSIDGNEPLCLIMYQGQRLSITTNGRFPVFVVNMRDSVLYGKKIPRLNFFERIDYILFGNQSVYPTRDSWSYIYENWHTDVETTRHAIVAEAKKNGLVCF